MVSELVGTLLFIVIKPFSLFKISCIAALRGTSIVINTWVEILSNSIYFQVTTFWRFIIWTIAVITLPARAVNALRREKQLQAQLSELEDRLDSLAWDRKELQEHIRIAIKEHETMEMILGELEEEHEEAIRKIKLLETELQDLKDENVRLKEVDGKSHWDTTGYVEKNKDILKISNPKDGISHRYKSGVSITDILSHKDAFDDEKKGKYDAHGFVESDVLGKRREAALSQSVFSALLSLLVGMIIWEAEDPCMPLVTALFMVVGMSLKSVVEFFSTIKNKPASDAVALLSLNWFILGTVTYPTLPIVARFLAPFFFKLLERAFGWFCIRLRV